MGNVSHLVTRTAAFQSSVENGLAEGSNGKDRQFVTALARVSAPIAMFMI